MGPALYVEFLRWFLEINGISLQEAMLRFGVEGILGEFEVWLEANSAKVIRRLAPPPDVPDETVEAPPNIVTPEN